MRENVIPLKNISPSQNIRWTLCMSISGENEHALLFRSELLGHGIQAEVITKVTKTGRLGKQKTSYFIDGDKRCFQTQEDLIKAVMEL